MSPKRLVIQRCFGFPLTLLKRIGQLPSSCFWMPVISKLGSTSFSVIIRSPSFFIHSMAPRRSLTSSGAAPSLFAAFAISFLQKSAFLPIVAKMETVQLYNISRKFLGPIGLQIWERVLQIRDAKWNSCLSDILAKVNEAMTYRDRLMTNSRVAKVRSLNSLSGDFRSR